MREKRRQSGLSVRFYLKREKKSLHRIWNLSKDVTLGLCHVDQESTDNIIFLLFNIRTANNIEKNGK